VNSIALTEDSLISIVLPVYNQAGHIECIVREYEAALSRLPNPHELILVVNGCHDCSLKICETLAEEIKSIRIIQSERHGWGRAVKLGLQNSQGDLLCYTNSARTNASDLLLVIIHALAHPLSVIKAHRRIRGELIRKIGSLLFKIQCRVLFDLPMWDINATPKVFPRDIYNTITLAADGDLIDLEFIVKCRQRGWPILEVGTYRWQRHSGESTTKFHTAFRLYLDTCRWWWEIKSSRNKQ
jgi:glycosyltransferase involved in cell wall biosynthesis